MFTRSILVQRGGPYQEFVHFFLIAVLRFLVKLLLRVLTRQKNVFSQHNKTDFSFLQLSMMPHQNLLDFNWSGFGLVHDHFLCNIFFPLHPVQSVICVTIQYRPS